MSDKEEIVLADIPHPALKIDKSRKIIDLNSLAEHFGVRVGTYCWDTFGKRESISRTDREYYETHNEVPEDGISCYFCRADEALEIKEHIIERIVIGDDTWETHWIPTDDENFIHFAKKVSGEK